MALGKEWQFLLFSILYGAEILFCYDFIRSLRNTWKHGKILIAAEDMCFWTAAGIFLFLRLFEWNNGVLRWHFFVGILMGMLGYAVVISPGVVKFVSFFLKRLKMFFAWVNIINRGIVTRVIRVLRINNGKNVETEKEESILTEDDTAE